jgi:phosphate transport system substrate-binding protein
MIGIIITIIQAAILIFVLIKLKTIRQRISVIIGLLALVLSFFIFIITAFFAERAILWTLLVIFFVSIIVFLVFWNIIKTKKVYLILSVPVICILTAIAVILYQNKIDEIPTISEPTDQYRMMSFVKLTNLDEEPNLKLIDNLPVLDGATALYPVYASFVNAVYPKPKSEDHTLREFAKCNTTIGAYENLLEGKVDIIFCAAPSNSQMKQFDDNGIKIKLIPIGREAFVFFVNKENIVDNLTVENIQGIYSGKIKNWKKLNGANQRIKAFQRPENSGSQTMLIKIMNNTPLMKPRRENVSRGMGDIINQVADYRNFSNAIGYSFLFYSTEMVKNDQIKLLSIEGIYPSKETIQNGTYPFSADFYAIYNTDNKNKNVEPFIEWILSEQGQKLISKTGYIPIKRDIISP